MQLPPFGSEWDGAQLHSLFDHLSPQHHRATARLRRQPGAFAVGPRLTPPRSAADASGSGGGGGGGGGGDGAARVMLSVSYRLPQELCAFISAQLYGGALRPGRELTSASCPQGAR